MAGLLGGRENENDDAEKTDPHHTAGIRRSVSGRPRASDAYGDIAVDTRSDLNRTAQFVAEGHQSSNLS